MERIRKEVICREKSGGHRASNKDTRTPSYRKGHQLYILSCFDSVRARVARATYIACALDAQKQWARTSVMLFSFYFLGHGFLPKDVTTAHNTESGCKLLNPAALAGD